MRLYAFILVAGAALHAHAASLPVSETEKKLIDIVPDSVDKVPENTVNEQELIDQANIIKDTDNQLRVKPQDIPVEVVVENAQPALKADEKKDEEIDRPVPDLRNPGPPQRQEHETQNPEFYASEQQVVSLFKQGVNDAQNALNQGIQGIANGIQNIIANNEPILSLQKSIQSLRDGFTAQINKIDGTIQSYLNTESTSVNQAAVEKTKAGFHQIEQGLFKLRTDFNREVNVLTDGVEIMSALKADGETPANSGTSVAPAPEPTPAPANPFFQILQNVQQSFTQALQNITQNVQNTFGQQGSSTAAPGAAAPDGVQSDSQTPTSPTTVNIIQNMQNQWSQQWQQWQPKPGQLGSGNGPIASSIGQFQNFLANILGGQGGNSAPAASTQTPDVKPDETSKKPEGQTDTVKPVSETPVAAVPVAPIRQILQNNPISQGIASAVQRLQNVNNPEKPREGEQVKEVVEKKDEGERGHGGGPNTGDNNDSSNSSDRIEEPAGVKEDIEKVPEVQKAPEVEKPSEDEIKEQKTEEVADKTE